MAIKLDSPAGRQARKRIACLVLPGVLLQAHARAAPHLRGTAFVVLTHTPRAVVAACSRPAHDAGVRAGMSVAQARAVLPSLTVVEGSPTLTAGTMAALADALLAASATVDVRTPGVIYALVPPRTLGQTFADKLLHVAELQGLTGRVGIADDRFTSYVAACVAAHSAHVRVVPRGGSAAFLAPLGLDLLPIAVDVRRMLALVGVSTLGDFATLPPPSVGCGWTGGCGVDPQALARGDGPTELAPFRPLAPIVESVELGAELHDLAPLAFVLRPLCERASARLAGRGRTAARTAIRLRGAGQVTEVVLAPALPIASGLTLVDLARAELAARTLGHAVASVEVAVLEESEAGEVELELELFAAQLS